MFHMFRKVADMKVVLFCGGQGIRLREYSDLVPKPMITIGYRPILWHLMKYYAHFGHKEFILCLGHKANVIKDYFLNYNECVSNDFTLSQGGRSVELANRDIADWSITFVDTGPSATIAERLLAVQPYLEGQESFLANYSDNLTDLHLPELIEDFETRRPVAAFLAVRPRQSFHVVQFGDDHRVRQIVDIGKADVWINGGYFVLSDTIFDYIRAGEELVNGPFDRLIEEGRLHAHRYDGFWACMDTLKDKQLLDEMYMQGQALWQVWQHPNAQSVPSIEMTP